MIKEKFDEKGPYLVITPKVISPGYYLGTITQAEWISDLSTKNGPQSAMQVTVELDSGETIQNYLFLTNATNSPLGDLLEVRQVQPGKKIRAKSFLGLDVGVVLKQHGDFLNIAGFFHPDDSSDYVEPEE